MKIFVNGEERETQAAQVAALLAELGLAPALVAVEHNKAVLFRQELEKTPLKEGDRLEIVRAVAGG
ncbi:MAG: sulfur carrier protein ThiS [Verrucomicrobiae bacterium]|nr:sulfur carrier protein ThiS [Verrucomicrobiae bacterium]